MPVREQLRDGTGIAEGRAIVHAREGPVPGPGCRGSPAIHRHLRPVGASDCCTRAGLLHEQFGEARNRGIARNLPGVLPM